MSPSRIFPFADGEETIRVRVTEHYRNEFTAVDDATYDCDCDERGFFSTSPVGYGDTQLSAIADLFEKLPRAASEREERDHQAARFDHARDLRKHEAM